MSFENAGRIGASAVLAWERSLLTRSGDTSDAIEVLASRVGGSTLGIVLELESRSLVPLDRLVEIGMQHRVRYLPLLHIDLGESSGAWPLETLLHLRSHDLLFEFAGIRYLLAAESTDPRPHSGLPSCLGALRTELAPVRIGWRRCVPRHVPVPPGYDFVMEWQPLDSGRVSVPVSPSVWPFSQFLCDVGKRVGRGMPISPSVLWSPRSECIIAERNMIVTGMSPSRTAYGTDVAARFVRNRGDAGVPFWILRVDLAPGDRADNHCLRALAKLLDTRSNSSASDACLFTTIAVPQTRSRIAVVLHLYYPEIWLELWSAVSQLPERFDLYVSCPFRLLPAVQQIVRAVCPTAVVFGVHNLGRDVLPFLLWLRAVGSEPYSYVLKLHSKRSKHLVETEQRVLGDGNAWRAQAVASLVGDRSCATRILAALDSQADVGLVGPSGHMFDQQEWRCATEDLLVTLMSRLGVDAEVRGNFPAGTMFWARGAVLQPLAKISEELMDFEREAGQVDGTLHHAYERAIALLTLYAGYRVIGTDELVDRSPARLT